MIPYYNVEEAFLFVSSAKPFLNLAVINRKTGETFYKSGLSGIDDFPEDVDAGDYIGIPHKMDLELGQELVFAFVEQYLPQKIDEVDQIFRRRGAYSRYKSLLESLGMLEKWHQFENEQIKEALLEWCRQRGLDISE